MGAVGASGDGVDQEEAVATAPLAGFGPGASVVTLPDPFAAVPVTAFP